MNGVRWISCCAVTICLGLPGGGVQAQFGGGGKSERAERAKKELQSAIDRAQSMMGSAFHHEAPAKAPRQDCVCVGETDSPSVAKIEQALAAPLRSSGLDFVEIPLEEVAALLEADYGISVELDTPALEEIGLGTDEPVTVNIRNMSLQSALRLMLKQLQLVYVIEHEVLMITTPEEAKSHFKVCVYDVRDLIDPQQPKAVQALVDVIASCAATETWAINGGDGQIRPLPPNLLVISQPQAVHEEVRGLLAAIREMRRRPAPVDAAAGGALRQPEPAEDDPYAF